MIFTLPEDDIDRIPQAITSGPLKIQAYAPDDRRKTSEGELKLIDNTVNQTTGTVQLKAEFANIDSALWPGQSRAVARAHFHLTVAGSGSWACPR